jgi:lipopolysaccharide assembly outer membrane protein LptD (OstA)
MSQDPYSLDLDLSDVENPNIEFFNVKEYSLNENGIKIEASAAKAERFSDRDILYDISVSMMENNATQKLESNNATLMGNTIYLNGNVRYIANDTIVTTEAVEYHQNSSMLIGKVPFRIEKDSIVAHGSSFSYFAKTGELKAYNIEAVIQMEK